MTMKFNLLISLLVIFLIGVGISLASTFTGFNSPFDAALNPAQTYLYVTNTGNNTVSVVNYTTGLITNTIVGFNKPEGIAISPNGTFAYVVDYGNDGLVRVSLLNNSIAGVLYGFGAPKFVYLATNGIIGYVTNSDNNTISVVNLIWTKQTSSTTTVTTTIPPTTIPLGAFSPTNTTTTSTTTIPTNLIAENTTNSSIMHLVLFAPAAIVKTVNKLTANYTPGITVNRLIALSPAPISQYRNLFNPTVWFIVLCVILTIFLTSIFWKYREEEKISIPLICCAVVVVLLML
jgi:YVTN family beta-propeller protein